jgi:hypothetical protein
VNESTTTKKQLDLGLPFCRMALRLGRRPIARDLEDLACFILSCYKTQDIQIDQSKIDLKKVKNNHGPFFLAEILTV